MHLRNHHSDSDSDSDSDIRPTLSSEPAQPLRSLEPVDAATLGHDSTTDHLAALPSPHSSLAPPPPPPPAGPSIKSSDPLSASSSSSSPSSQFTASSFLVSSATASTSLPTTTATVAIQQQFSSPTSTMSPLTTTSILSPRSLRKRSLPTLPSELILHIFKFLTTPHDLRVAILVCKLWCTCGMDLLWSRPALLSSSVVEQITQTLSLEPSEMTFPYRDHVRRLNFSLVARDLVDEELVRFACCTRLERLILQGCTQITPDALLRILMAGQALVSLDLSEITTVGDSVIEQVATYCTKLHTLYIASCNAVTDSSISKLAQSCPSLKRIKLSRCVLLTDESVLALTRFCPQLMEIDVTNCLLMSSYGIRTIFQNLPQIRDLNLSVFTNLTDLAFSCIPLGSSSTSSASSQSMTSSSSSLSLRSSSHSLQNSSPGRFEHLRILNLTSCTAITDDALLRILPAAPRLRNLTLTKCDRLTDVGVMAIKVLGKHLHYLHLGHCSRLTDRSITTLAQHCTRIRYLDLACCSRITDAAVFALAQLQKLRRIGLVKCSNITDHGIYAMLVSQVLPRTLERVHLSYCIHLSDTAVAALVSHCTKLTHLSVTGVPAFMNPRYQIFCRVAPTEFTPQQRDVFCVFSGKGVRELRQFMAENPILPMASHTASSTSTSQVTGPVTPAATPNAVTEVHDGTTTADLGMSDDMDVDGEMEMDADVEMGAETEVTPGATSTAVDQAAGSSMPTLATLATNTTTITTTTTTATTTTTTLASIIAGPTDVPLRNSDSSSHLASLMAARQLHYQRLYQVQQLQLQAHYQHVQRQQLQQQLWQQQQQQRPFIQHGQAVVEGGLGGADTHVESLAISQGNQGFFPGSSSRTTLVESETTHGSSPILALAPSREIETAARDVEMGQVPEMMLRGMSLSREEERASLLSLAAGQMNGPELADYHLDVVHGSDKLSLIPSPSPSPSSSSSTSTSSASSSSSTTPSLPSLKSVSTIAQDACQFGSGMPINVETAEVQLVQPSFNLTAVAGIDSDAEKCVALLDKNIVQETAVGASACAAGYRNDDDDDDDDTVSTVTDAKTHASTDQVHSVKGDEDDEEEDAEGGDGYGASHGSPTEEEDEDGGDDRDDNE